MTTCMTCNMFHCGSTDLTISCPLFRQDNTSSLTVYLSWAQIDMNICVVWVSRGVQDSIMIFNSWRKFVKLWPKVGTGAWQNKRGQYTYPKIHNVFGPKQGIIIDIKPAYVHRVIVQSFYTIYLPHFSFNTAIILPAQTAYFWKLSNLPTGFAAQK